MVEPGQGPGREEPGQSSGSGQDPGRAATGRAYLAGLVLDRRRVVVVGGGEVAQRRLPSLLAAGADVVVVAPEVTPAVEALAGGGELTWWARGYRPGDVEGAWYALALTSDPGVNAAVAAEAEAARVFCVRADDATGGTAVTPATGRHGRVRIGVLGGGDPRRAAVVRDGVVDALREGRIDSLARRGGKTPGVAIVGGGPGDPDLITVRGRRLLAHADVVVADRLAPQGLLEELPPHVEVVDAAKLPRGRAMAQEAINALLVDRARQGRYVVRLKGGDPFVFGRGFEEVEACVAAGVAVTVVPGITSAVGVPGLAGIPLTHRGVAHEAVVVSGHLAPGDPESLVDWTALARLRGTLVVLMGVERLDEIAKALLDGGRSGATPVAIVQDGTLPGERTTTTVLADLAETVVREEVRPPAIVVVGEVVALGDRLRS
ncbi:MAG: uroporphyrinogen-III C-methyltransferase [Actinomycetales bacterium]|nr:uroporphyrinogen-III C-methyltransferase [Actinomycetales bacterium]